MKLQVILFFIAVGLTSAQLLSSPLFVPLLPSCSGKSCCSFKTISVQGSSTVSGQPDIASLSVSLKVSADTTDQAISGLSTQVNQVINILNRNGLNSSAYSVSSVDVFPNSSWATGKEVILGQIASESLSIKIPNVKSDGSNIGSLIDGLSAINGITIDGLSFDISDKTNLTAAARSRAYADALTKAQDYTSFAGLALGNAVTISDAATSSVPPRPFAKTADIMAFNAASAPTTITVGKVDVTYSLSAVFSFY